jgi:hypothetical protein
MMHLCEDLRMRSEKARIHTCRWMRQRAIPLLVGKRCCHPCKIVVSVQLLEVLDSSLYEEWGQDLILELGSKMMRLVRAHWSGRRLFGRNLKARGRSQIRPLLSSVDLTIRLMKRAPHTLLNFHIIILSSLNTGLLKYQALT